MKRGRKPRSSAKQQMIPILCGGWGSDMADDGEEEDILAISDDAKRLRAYDRRERRRRMEKAVSAQVKAEFKALWDFAVSQDKWVLAKSLLSFDDLTTEEMWSVVCNGKSDGAIRRELQ